MLRNASASIDVQERFNRLGLDSANATGLVTGLSKFLKRPLPATLVWQFPTIDSLSRYLAGEVPIPAGERRTAAGISEPIAIVGMACRFPKANHIDAFWELLSRGTDAIGEVPSARWAIEDWFDEESTAPGKMSTRWGGFLDNIDGFEPRFFGISPREASVMDPQQRLTLEVVWEALEDAHIPPSSLKGTTSGVFLGSMWNEYGRLCSQNPARITSHSATGQDSSILAGRVSYTFGLSGPSLTVNTACSSSLVAVHLACQSLQAGECGLALAGGVNLMLTPESTVAMSKFGALALDGRSKAFDARANGYVRGEGAGMVVLKPLAAALAAGDSIYGVIRGSAMNNDGFSNGLTAPNPEAQAQVLRDAYARAGVDVHRVQYVEAHGTGTFLGDPIEASALGAVLGAGREAGKSLLIGSVKTNIGHLEAAAGIAGLLKVVLAMRHGLIPPSLHFETPNPHIAFEELRLAVPAVLQPWPESNGRATAGVSSFGFGGTNCHVVVEAWERGPAIAQQTEAARERQEKLAFVFSGHGSQWLGMARRLLDEPVFRAKLRQCEKALRRWTDWSLLEVLAVDAKGRLQEIGVVQPVLFALQVSLAALWQSWGVRPGAVVGHSVGEAAAAHVAGILTLEDAARLVCHRSRLLQSKAGRGAMAVLDLGAEEACALLKDWQAARDSSICFAGANSPLSTVFSGEPEAVEFFLALARERGVVSHRINVDVASHSPQFDDVKAELAESLEGLEAQAGTVPMASSVTGCFIPGCEFDRSYWVRNLREPVLFSQAIECLVREGFSLFLEISPHPILSRSVQETWTSSSRASEGDGIVLPSLRRDEDEYAVLRGSLAEIRRRIETVKAQIEDRPSHVLALSAKTEEALRAIAVRFEDYLETHTETPLADVCHSANSGREHFAYRFAGVANSGEAMRARLAALRRERVQSTTKEPKIAFLYPGAGSQYAGMGRELYETQPTFREALERCDRALRKQLEKPLLQVLFADGDALETTEYAQPALFAVEHAFTELWRSWGIRPDIVLGQGVGEYAAACAMEEISPEDALQAIVKGARTVHENAPLATLAKAGVDVFVEAGPGRTLLDRVAEYLRDAPADLLPTSSKNHGDWDTALESLKKLYVRGAAVDWAGFDAGYVRNRVHGLPTYAFQRERYWVENVPAVPAPGAIHPLLRQRVRSAVPTFEAQLAAEDLGYLQDHRMHGAAVFPAAAYLEAGLAAAKEISGEGPHAIENLALHTALTRNDATQFLQVVLDGSALKFFSMRPDGEWTLHANGEVGKAARVSPRSLPIEEIWSRCQHEVRVEEHWEQWRERGLDYGPAFRAITALRHSEDEAIARIRLPERGKRYGVHPVLLDACLQMAGALLEKGPMVPALVERYRQFQPTDGEGWGHAVRRTGSRALDFWLANAAGDVVAEISGVHFVAAKRQALPGEIFREWLYGVVWRERPSEPAKSAAGNAAQRWLILSDSAGIGAELAERLQADGQSARWMQEREDLDQAVRGTDALVYVCDGRRGLNTCKGVMRAAQALARLGSCETPRLWIVTERAQAVFPNQAPVLECTPVLGLAKVIALEHPEFQCGCIDVDGGSGSAERIFEEITRNGGESQIAFREGRRYVARLVKTPRPMEAAPEVRGDGAYLISGGFGGLGVLAARWLFERGARHLVLIGRSAPSQTASETLDALRAGGAQIMPVQADVADAGRMAEVFAEIRASCLPLRGVIHAAAVFDDGLLAHQSWERFEKVLSPKARGAWNLHALTENSPLDFFVMFSSVASVLGSAGQANYAAANSYLDALAHYRGAKGAPALSVNWGPWGGVGAAATRNLGEQFNQRGLDSIPPEQGLLVLGQVLSASGQVMAAPVRWQAFPKTPLLEELESAAPRASGAEGGAAGAAEASSLEEIMGLPRNAAVAHLVSRVRLHTAEALGMDWADLELPSRPFEDLLLAELGMDSLASNDLRNALRQEFGIDIPVSRIIGEKVASLADGLYDGLLIRRVSNLAGQAAETSEERETYVF